MRRQARQQLVLAQADRLPPLHGGHQQRTSLRPGMTERRVDDERPGGAEQGQQTLARQGIRGRRDLPARPVDDPRVEVVESGRRGVGARGERVGEELQRIGMIGPERLAGEAQGLLAQRQRFGGPPLLVRKRRLGIEEIDPSRRFDPFERAVVGDGRKFLFGFVKAAGREIEPGDAPAHLPCGLVIGPQRGGKTRQHRLENVRRLGVAPE
jgi:hypothetical protein